MQTHQNERRSRFGRVALAVSLAASASLAMDGQSRAQGSSQSQVETITIFRHGEKPSPAGLGQLSCQGLNRSLALPAVLAKYGTPTKLLAPDPAVELFPDGFTTDMVGAGPEPYVRPLATIEPFAIASQLPVDVAFAYDDTDGVAEALKQTGLRSANVFIAWEHGHIKALLDAIFSNMASFHIPSSWTDQPGWDENDYDTIYIVQITTAAGQDPKATFATACEGLGNGGSCTIAKGNQPLSTTCPTPAPSSDK